MAAAYDAAEAQPLVGRETMYISKSVPPSVRSGFVRKVYSVLFVQLLLTVAIAAPLQMVSTSWLQGHVWLLYASTAMMLASICVMMCCGERLRQFPDNYIFLFLFTLCTGITVGFASAAYTAKSVFLAAGITTLIFGALTIYASVTSTDFTGYGPYLFAFICTLSFLGFALCLMSLCGVHMPFFTAVYNALGVLLFCFYIIFDTQMILGEWGGHKVQFSIDDYAFASLNLYLDIINLFLHLLKLLGEKK